MIEERPEGPSRLYYNGNSHEAHLSANTAFAMLLFKDLIAKFVSARQGAVWEKQTDKLFLTATGDVRRGFERGLPRGE